MYCYKTDLQIALYSQKHLDKYTPRRKVFYFLFTDLKNTNLVMLSPYESENNSLQNFQFSK